MSKVETVKVVREDHPDGYVVINKSDMTKTDKIFKEPETVVIDENVEKSFEEMSAKELKQACKDAGIDYEGKKEAIEALNNLQTDTE